MQYRGFLGTILLIIMLMGACKKKDMAPTGMLDVNDQTISQNMVMINSVTMSADGWIVIHADAGGGPKVPDIISEPVWVGEGTNINVQVPFTSSATLMDGQTVWVMLHTDDGVMGQYEFDGNSDIDAPITENETPVMKSITINSASITVQDQPVSNNAITIPKVEAAADGWLVVHNDDGTGNIVLPGIIGKVQVSKGMNQNVAIQLDPNNTYTPGQKLFPMLHLDNGQVGVYEFDGQSEFDGSEIFGNEAFPANVIFTNFTVQ